MTTGTKVLVVDDEQIARLTLQRILQMDGYEVLTVGSGEEALAALDTDRYDVMLLDLVMPGMTGLDVLAKMSKANTDLKVIVLTAFGSMDSAIQALRFHVHDYLVKPVTKEQVLSSVKGAVESHISSVEKVTESRTTYSVERGRRAIYQVEDGIMIDCDRRIISWNTNFIHLTPTEAKLMRAFLDAPTVVFSHTELVFFSHAFKAEQLEAARILRPVFSRLRTKLEVIPGAQDWIRNVRGAGYVFEGRVTRL